jgi:hypothetical protein
MVDSWEEENKRMRRMKRKNPLQLWGRLLPDAFWIGFITNLFMAKFQNYRWYKKYIE